LKSSQFTLDSSLDKWNNERVVEMPLIERLLDLSITRFEWSLRRKADDY
jgi:hypothetical protein